MVLIRKNTTSNFGIPMSRAAVDRNPASYGGMSRLPRPVGQGQLGTYQSKLQNGPAGGQKPSKLEMMQAEFQKNILKEKEQKMISMYEENQQKALQRVNYSNNSNNKGMVRDFFRERRALGSGNSQTQNQPTMEHLFNRKKLEHKLSNSSMGRTQSYHGNYPQKQSAGRDRSNLLAPINGPGKNGSPSNPFPHKAQIVRPRTYKDVSSNNANKDHKQLPMSAPTGAMMSDYSSDDSPPPNPKQLQMLQQKRMMLKNQRNNVTQVTRQPVQQQQPQKKTDFQKWQEEQDHNRANRLKKYQETNSVQAQKHQPYVDDEGYDDDSVESDDIDPQEEMKRKQAELLRQIEEQQRELDRLRNERMQEEIEEKKEKARRKKMEEERQRREKEEEDYRRKMEEDERIKRTFEEEKQKKIAEEKERLRKQSQTSGFEYEESDEEEQNYHHFGYKQPSPSPQKRQLSPPQQKQYKPSAPSKPKPSNTRKYHPPQSRTPPQRESPPLVKGDHTAMYRNADQQEGAFENISNLVSCYNCGRNFAEDRIEKHEKFCKNLTKKRKVLDPTKLRTQGTEMAQYVGTKQPNPKSKKNNWREKHESFINAIKYAKKCKQIKEQGGSLADLPPPPRSENPDYVQCPYCTRRFNPQTAERHIPHCKNTKSRPAPPKRR